MKQIKIQEGFDFPRPPLGTESGSPASWPSIFLGTLSPWQERREELECAALTSPSLPAAPAWEEARETEQTGLPSAFCSFCQVLTSAQGTRSIDSCTLLRDARGGPSGVYDGQESALFGAKPVYAS